MILAVTARMTAGIQIHKNSLHSTANARAVKNLDSPIGDTGMGRQGRKYRVLVKGEKRPRPGPRPSAHPGTRGLPWPGTGT